MYQTEAEHLPFVPDRPDQRQRVLHWQQAGTPVPQTTVRSLLLSRSRAGEEEVRTPGMEHPLRVQRDGLEDQHPTAQHVPQPIRRQ